MVFPALDPFRLDDLHRKRRASSPEAQTTAPPGKLSGLARASALAQVHMQEFGDRYPAELGDGMKKARSPLRRALTLDPRYVLFRRTRRRASTLVSAPPRRPLDSRTVGQNSGVTSVVVSTRLDVDLLDRHPHRRCSTRAPVRLLGAPADFRGSSDELIQQIRQRARAGPMET